MVTSLAGLRVFVVEDDMMVSMLVEDMLADFGCVQIGPAARLDEAVALLSRSEPDCAILDVNLAGVSVLPVADLLQARGVPYAFASGYADVGLRPQDSETLLLQKPFTEVDLARILTSLSKDKLG